MTVKEVKILGQKFPVRYDINALGELEELTGQNTLDGSLVFNIRALHALAYVGLKHGHRYQHNGASEFSKSLEDVGAWLPIADLKLFIPVFTSFTMGDQEKKATSKTPEPSGESPGAV